ncbi:MAG: gamma-glutamylcyclotransferase [Candidatus Eremiobacteraeota bacterium]|nr:gamma-glutamylcyclotransferase [Candidatus Eremiobacteraeota bacterium]
MPAQLYGLNFAYGSNLDGARLRARCPRAVNEGAVTVHGYRLEFYGAADLERDPASTVGAVAWRLDEHDERELDRHEGIGRLDRPDSYVKLPVPATRGDGTIVWGYVYLMTPARRRRDPRVPIERYVEHLATGYREHGFDAAALAAALARASSPER